MIMTNLKEMTKKELYIFFLAATFGGFMVGVGGVGLLISMSAFEGAMGQLIGAIIFSLAMFVVTVFGLYLVTGLSTSIVTMGKHNWLTFFIALVFNVVGIALSALLVNLSHVEVNEIATVVMNNKICDDGWVLHSLCSGILCGILIGLSVFLSKYAAKKHLSSTVGVIFPVFVFVFCGFDNSLANLFYTLLSSHISLTMIGYFFVSLIGNMIGGVLVSLLPILKEMDKLHGYDDE